ncbi:MAG: M48 family metallopeptidase [Oscillospiraceae bacterium]|nr:M48 family metallopeptidase [Oscillospiraceae bacterium]
MQQYNLVRSNRKTIGIHLTEAGVEVRAPYSVPRSEIEKTLKEKEDWINEKLLLFDESAASRKTLSLTFGSSICILGKEYTITTSKIPDRMRFTENELQIPQGLPDLIMAKNCVRLLKLLARRLLIEKVNKYASLMDINPYPVHITDAKKRWGSCSSTGRLNFAWRLILTDDYSADYVVVHELAHIKEMNHSKHFHGLLNSIDPDAKEHAVQLRRAWNYVPGWAVR